MAFHLFTKKKTYIRTGVVAEPKARPLKEPDGADDPRLELAPLDEWVFKWRVLLT